MKLRRAKTAGFLLTEKQIAPSRYSTDWTRRLTWVSVGKDAREAVLPNEYEYGRLALAEDAHHDNDNDSNGIAA